MDNIIMLLLGVMLMTSCIKSSTQSEKVDLELAVIGRGQNFSTYGQLDSVFVVKGKVYTVDVKQFDLTDKVKSNGGAMTMPTYTCAVSILDVNKKVVFADSILRDSWDSIDAYQMKLPQLRFEAPEIILSFNIFEEYGEEAVTGCVAFDINTQKSRYYWKEPTLVKY